MSSQVVTASNILTPAIALLKLYFKVVFAWCLLQVLRDLQRNLLQYKDSHISILEVSHRSKEFTNILEECEKAVRQLL